MGILCSYMFSMNNGGPPKKGATDDVSVQSY